MPKREYPFMIIDTQMNAALLKSEDLKILEKFNENEILLPVNRQALYRCVSKFLNGDYEVSDND